MLDVIACRNMGVVEGSIVLNNSKVTQKLFRRHASYVIQADRLLAHLTVRETLTYTAKLQFAGKLKTDEIKYQARSPVGIAAVLHVYDMSD